MRPSHVRRMTPSRLRLRLPRLADARSGVVEEQEQRVVARSKRSPAIWLRDDGGRFLRLEIRDLLDNPRFLHRNSQDSVVLPRPLDVVTNQVLNEAADPLSLLCRLA